MNLIFGFITRVASPKIGTAWMYDDAVVVVVTRSCDGRMECMHHEDDDHTCTWSYSYGMVACSLNWRMMNTSSRQVWAELKTGKQEMRQMV
jgi:hypothetical protein